MSHVLPASPPDGDHFRPSEYTAALLRQVRLRAPWHGRVLEMGSGSGVVLAALAVSGARQIVGVDIEPEAVRRTRALLEALPMVPSIVHCGDLWEPLAGELFDLVVFNPPQLPVRHDTGDVTGTAGAAGAIRLRSWSDGGALGRDVLDRFIAGLPGHLAPDALALITHSSFMSLEETLRQLEIRSLRAEVVETVTVPMSDAKLRQLPPGWLEQQSRQSVYRIGPYVFCDFHVLEIRHAAATPIQ
ncbi:methyltransferase [Roseateles aquatilis]|nr:methyltransferase [Roseateles aquatilis]